MSTPDEIARDMLVEEFDAIVKAAGRAWAKDQPGTIWSSANRDWYLVAAAREKAEAERDEAVRLLTRAATILSNMAQENPDAVFRPRWPIHHEPLRADAKNLLPEILSLIPQEPVSHD